jgi:hypothetical protein
MRPTAQQQAQQQQTLQDMCNSSPQSAFAVRHHKHSSWRQQEQKGPSAGQAPTGTLTVEADALRLLLDKVSMFDITSIQNNCDNATVATVLSAYGTFKNIC